MPDTSPTVELDAYLRLNRAGLGEWRAAIRELSGCEEMACRLHHGSGPVGDLSAVDSDQGAIVCISAAQGMDIAACSVADPIFLLSLSGTPQMAMRGGSWQPLTQLTFARSDDCFHLRLPESSRVLILRPRAGIAGNPVDLDSGARRIRGCQELIDCYLHRSPFFRDHNHAREMTSKLFSQLNRVVHEEPTPTCNCPWFDRRLVRAVEKIRGDSAWDFNLKELASYAGVSERNLYYLMKRETGMTPYRLYQRNRLIRVRRRLVDCQCEVPHISRYAADEGFSHLGRFAALYREHFGELPSETVQWRRTLQGEAGELAGQPLAFS